MRDTSTDFETGWLFDNNYYTRTPHLERALAGLGEVAVEYIKEALHDPDLKVREAVEKIMSDPAAMAAQAERDIAEAAHPTGALIVFKGIARKMASKVSAIENAVVAAMPDKNTEAGEIARAIISKSDSPAKDLREFYTAVAADAAGVPLFDDSGEVESWTSLDGLGKASKAWRRWKTIAKVGKIVAIGAAAVIAAPYAVAAAKAVGGAVIGGVKALFGGGTSKTVAKIDQPAPGPFQTDQSVDPGQALEQRMAAERAGTPTAPPGGDTDAGASLEARMAAEKAGSAGPAIPWDALAAVGVGIIKAKRAAAKAKAQGDPNAAAYEQQAAAQHQQAVQQLVSQGIPQQQAEQVVSQAEQQADAQLPKEPTAPGTSASASAGGAPVGLLIAGGVALFAFAGGGKGGGRRRR